MDLSLLYGRRELVAKADLPEKIPAAVQLLPTIEVGTTRIRCLRCNATTPLKEARLPRGQSYCPQCLNLGRVSTLDQFYHVAEPNQFAPIAEPLTWSGTLSPLQVRVAAEVKDSMLSHEQRLLWAVTGAGKTEMIFPTIEQAIRRGERVCIASPRVDVCLELFPRLRAAFQSVPMVLLHGRQEEPYKYCQLTICTTHQLLRFYHAFDLLIVDEVDSFPYAANEQLLYATTQAKKTTGGLLMMTATPGEVLQRQIKAHRLAVSYLPLRYHGHLLPKIRCVQIDYRWQEKLKQGHSPRQVGVWIRQHLRAQKRFLLFVPHIENLADLRQCLQRELPQCSFTTVYANDEQRLAKVQRMRDHQYDFLVTTTILERGVTFPGIDVCVLGADEKIFSSSALVQIAGRVGRSSQCPDGNVTFFVKENARNVKAAYQQIKYLNRLGRRIQ
ncbi:DEAD/DEAH box helicase [Limosilactobacillus caecicola]|uniref:DEAD/DEAH box helicase n=1 Tax=Limosilactobacillus caecicola TaxID=2941332 RepID=UPI00203F0804|nr:helicase-related protein [Limosilactobacillus caecicola]